MTLNRKIAIINLDSNEIDIQPVSREWRRKFLGGRGLSAYLLFKHTTPGCDALDHDNTIVLGAGLLGGILSAPVECAQLMTKSPLTHRLGCALLSGFFASEMRWAGFDHLVISGRAQQPIYLWIHNGNIQIRSAKNIWGQSVRDSRNLIRKELGDENIRLICIGPAGENRVRFGNITAERNQVSGRTGLGAILGSKLLKAVVCRGEMDIQIKHPADALNYQKEFLDKILSTQGTSFGPVTARENESARPMTRLADFGEQLTKPIYPEHRLIADLGLDPLITESMVRWAQALYENKLITVKDTAGLRLGPGTSEGALDMIKQIALREGFGDILAQGPVLAAHKVGAESLKFFAPQAQLFEMYTENSFDGIPHTLSKQSLGYTAPTTQTFMFAPKHLPENDNNQSPAISDQITELAGARQEQFSGSAGTVLWQELYETACQCLGFCLDHTRCLGGDHGGFTILKKLIQLNTGLNLSEKNIQDCAYRCYAIERLFNLRESEANRQKQGRDQEIDVPVGLQVSKKLLNNLNLKNFRRLVNDYYRSAGWDKATVVKLKILRELELDDLWPLVKQKGGH